MISLVLVYIFTELKENHICVFSDEYLISLSKNIQDEEKEDSYSKCPMCNLINFKIDGCAHVICRYCGVKYNDETGELMPSTTNEEYHKLKNENKLKVFDYKFEIKEYPYIKLPCGGKISINHIIRAICKYNITNHKVYHLASFLVNERMGISHLAFKRIISLIIDFYTTNIPINNNLLKNVYFNYILEYNYNENHRKFVILYSELIIDMLINIIEFKGTNLDEFIDSEEEKFHKLFEYYINIKGAISQ